MKKKSRTNLLSSFKVFAVLLPLMLMFTACGNNMGATSTEAGELTGSQQSGSEQEDGVMLQGYDISTYEIVYSSQDANSEVLAQWLANEIRDLTELQLTVKSDEAEITGREILIGVTNRTGCSFTTQTLKQNGYLIGVDETSVCARGADAVGTRYAVCDLMTAFTESLAEGKEVMLADSKVAQIPESNTLKAMSFNVLYDDISTQRELSVIQTILRNFPDTFGIQEGTLHWMQYFRKTIGSIYGSVGIGRDGTEDSEHTAIFYRKDCFELVEGATKWLSDTPDKVSKFEESSQTRIFTYAILTDKQTDTNILVVNAHLDQTSGVGRDRQAVVLMEFIQQYPEYPVVLTGDFNTMDTSETYKIVTEQLLDAAETAEVSEKSFTYIGSKKTIDFIFVSPEKIDVLNYRVITRIENGRVPSDHYPIIMEYNITNEKSGKE